MPLRHKNTGKILEYNIEEVEDLDYAKIKQSEEFIFDWMLEQEQEVYKIYLLAEKNEILGLVSLIDIPREYRIHLNLIEVGKTNRGKTKIIENIAGCLIAFSCSLAFARSYDGFVSLQPKTKLISLYQNRYGFSTYGRFLAVEQAAATALIQQYLLDE